jgi:hypothetical protein
VKPGWDLTIPSLPAAINRHHSSAKSGRWKMLLNYGVLDTHGRGIDRFA